MKKDDLPAMPFYFGDWRKAGEVRALDLDVRMIWFEMLGYMWESTERGFLTLNGKPVNTSVITKMIGVDITAIERALQQMEEFNVFSRREDGAIYCRKMVRDEEKRQGKSNAGKEGMKVRYSKNKVNSVITGVITKPLTNHESENEVNNSFCFDLIETRKIFHESKLTQEQTQRLFKISESETLKYINDFFDWVEFNGSCVRSLNESKDHFKKWLKIQLDKKPNGKDQPITTSHKRPDYKKLAEDNAKLLHEKD